MITLTVDPSSLLARGDAALRLPAGQHEVSIGPCDPLHSLEVSGGADVEVLDASALPDDVMLYVRGLPRLRRLVLPRGAGAHLHLDLAQAPALRVDGCLSWVDACWPGPGGMESLSAAWNECARALRPVVVRSAWLGIARDAPEDVDLLAVCGEPSLALDLSAHKAVCVVVEHAPELHALTVGSPHLLFAKRVHALRTLGMGQVGAACVEDALPLHHVSGGGVQLSLRDSARVDTLVVDGAWEHLLLHREGPRRLDAKHSRRFRSDQVRRLVHKDCALGDPGPEPPRGAAAAQQDLQAVIQAIADGQELTQGMVGRFLNAASKTNPQPSLEALAALAASNPNASRSALWALRMKLSRQQRCHDKAADPGWAWSFPADLADRGWRADIRLWLLCRANSGSARGYEPVICAASEPYPLAAVAGAAWEAHREGRAAAALELVGILDGQLAAGPSRGRFVRPCPPPGKRAGAAPNQAALDQLHLAASKDITDPMKLVVRELVRLRDRPEAPELVEGLLRWIVARLPDGSGIDLLGALHALGAGGAVGALAEVIALRGLPDDLRHKALTLSMTVPQHGYLAFPGRSHRDR